MRPFKLLAAASLAVASAFATASAHEFWIEPEVYRVEPLDVIKASVRVGQLFKGTAQPYVPERQVSFTVTDLAGERGVSSRRGDFPAINEQALRGGLHVFATVTTALNVNYATFGKFETFVNNHGLGRFAEAHKARGYPDENFNEAYIRYGKSLVGVGTGAGADRALGLKFELVALTNPYTDDLSDGVEVELLFLGAPMAGTQIDIFQRPDKAAVAAKTHVVTDDAGRARIPVGAGGEFMINAVHIVEPSPASKGRYDAYWESLWASMTYEARP